ncbi:hypothetical protein Y1Q_0016002 [Alligator mississippiensis]|uniref:Phospholipase A2 n=1 Tax=Alligator mississippiensis TaxID=8496 RepID=A0A151MVA3_ALLMI|nr:hypothetical protein Y1Q_0016002 [Alligator mississippiensis]
MLPLLAAVLFQKKKRKDTGLYHWRREKHPYYNLTVKILRARNIKGTDLLSKADCYVELKLPAASPVTSQTQVVDNSSDPEWNETFQYRIHSAVKNILELTLFDKDVLISDELTSVVFDVGGIKPGQPLKRVFKLNPEDNEELDVEFYLEKCSDAPTEILTNGVLVAHPSLCLKGTINQDKSKQKDQGNCQVKLSMPGAYEKQLCFPLKPDDNQDCGIPFVFHVDKEMCPDLEVELEQTTSFLQDGMSHDIEKQTTVLGSGVVPVKSLPVGQKVDMIVPLGEGQCLDFSMTSEVSPWDLDIRLGFDLCKQEREFLDKRKQVVAEALKTALNLRETPGKDEVPVVAVLGSGGGTRALTSLYGSLSGLQQLGLLDSTTYVCGISGSTWCLSTLYQDADWSQKDLQDAIIRARNNVSNSKAGAFSPERLKYYFQELNSMENDRRKVSFTDLWGLIVEYFLQQKEDPSKLSDQQKAVELAQNPYPIYAAINVRPNISGDDFAEWCEFTPYEVGFRKYGAFVHTEDFDSEFFMGQLIQKRPEPRICYLQGMWGSAFAASLDDICLKVVGMGLSFLEPLKDVIKVIDDCRRSHFRDPTRLKTRLVIPGGPLLQIFQDFFKSRFTSGETFNFMQGLYLHRDYVNIKKFVAWKGTHLDAFPNQLTPMEDSLYLVDGGFSINSPFPLVLQSERDVDVIVSFNYSWEAPFEVLNLTQKYCEEREIPFPKIILSKEDEKKPKECYMFMDDEDPKAPIVLHFPLVNDTFQKYKAPGIERESEDERSFGDFVIENKDSPYRTLNFTFEPYDFDRLLVLGLGPPAIGIWSAVEIPGAPVGIHQPASVRGTETSGLKGAWTQSLMFHAVPLHRMSAQMLPLLSAVLFRNEDIRFYGQRHETHPYYNLTVKLLRARNIRGIDLYRLNKQLVGELPVGPKLWGGPSASFHSGGAPLGPPGGVPVVSKANCYVALKLPAASPFTSRTQVVYNSSHPEWNETFEYRIHSAVKNILEFTFYDKDVVMDSHAKSIAFDVGNIKPGQALSHTFVLNPQKKEKKEELDVEFYLEESADSENRRKIPFFFHVDREIHPQLDLELLQTTAVIEEGWTEDLKMHTARLGTGSVPVGTLPLGQEAEFSVLLGKEQGVDLTIKVEECLQELDVRLSFDLAKGERDFLDRRKERASFTLRRLLGLPKKPRKNEVPVVAVVGSGGGMRAMTALYGNLLGLQKLNLLDILIYLCGISGSTWCLSKLYADPYWSQKDLQEAIGITRQLVTSSKVGAFSAERLAYYFHQLFLLEKEGWKVTLTDLWGLIIEYFLHQKEDPSKLSDQQAAVRWGQNPFPVYAAVNVRPHVGSNKFTEWCEFTPHEFGILKYGAFIHTEDFGSEFFMGLLLKKRAEPRISFLQGIWSSAFAANLDEIWEEVVVSKVGFLETLRDAIKVADEAHGYKPVDTSELETRMVMPGGAFSNLFQGFFSSRVSTGENVNFMHGLHLHKDYLNAKQFVAWKGLDAFPNKLTPQENRLYLIDGFFSINSPFPLMLQQGRDVDVILSFNYSWEAPFEVLHQTQKYCEDREIPFPHIAVSEKDRQKPKECYMFMDAENPKAPIVLHFPLVNNTFQQYKAPGVERETANEKSFGNFLIEGADSPYRSMNFTYKPNEFDRLLELSCYNVLNNKDTILKALALGMKRRALKKARRQ